MSYYHKEFSKGSKRDLIYRRVKNGKYWTDKRLQDYYKKHYGNGYFKIALWKIRKLFKVEVPKKPKEKVLKYHNIRVTMIYSVTYQFWDNITESPLIAAESLDDIHKLSNKEFKNYLKNWKKKSENHLLEGMNYLEYDLGGNYEGDLNELIYFYDFTFYYGLVLTDKNGKVKKWKIETYNNYDDFLIRKGDILG